MGWTSKMRANRFSHNFKQNGEYRGDKWNIRTSEQPELSEDTKLRMEILKEIDTRIVNEDIDLIVSEIAKRIKVKTQFSYYEKNGMTDLAGIIKGWYESYKKNLPRRNNMIIR